MLEGESNKRRLRIFAGPNGSGKTTLIRQIRRLRVNGNFIDFGYYVNADDIAFTLEKRSFSFKQFGLIITSDEFIETAVASGLLAPPFTQLLFEKAFVLKQNKLRLLKKSYKERLAQIIADVVRKKLLQDGQKFTFETVFSHQSKLDIIKHAQAAGYKVYLYFISTEDPEINRFRVRVRVKDGGHPVPVDKIIQRYHRSMTNLFPAAMLADQTFIFDNSLHQHTRSKARMIYKCTSTDVKDLQNIPASSGPNWFNKFFLLPYLNYLNDKSTR